MYNSITAACNGGGGGGENETKKAHRARV